MGQIKLFDYEFREICEIMPELDKSGVPKQFQPQSRFNNVSNLPLHQYGQGPFCQFRIPNSIHKAGVYVVLVEGTPKYVGECEDLVKRWNMGYGHISPRNCFKGGRETNCRINNLILTTFRSGSQIKLIFHETINRFEIENDLKVKLNPDWNIEKRPIKPHEPNPIAKHTNFGNAKVRRNKYQELGEFRAF